MASVLDTLRGEGVTRVLVLPLYPQYAAATTASVGDAVMRWAMAARRTPELRFVNEYHDDPGYIAALAEQRAATTGARTAAANGWCSASTACRTARCCSATPTTASATRRRGCCANGWASPRTSCSSPSRAASARPSGCEPYTEPTLVALAQQGVKRVDVMCPGFTADCLETLEEIDQEAREAFLHAGGERFEYIACLNDRPRGCRRWPWWPSATCRAGTRRPRPMPRRWNTQRALALAMGAPE